MHNALPRLVVGHRLWHAYVRTENDQIVDMVNSKAAWLAVPYTGSRLVVTQGGSRPGRLGSLTARRHAQRASNPCKLGQDNSLGGAIPPITQ